MTAREALDMGKVLAGLTNKDGSLWNDQTPELAKSFVVMVNLVYSDLYDGENFIPVSSLDDNLYLPQNILNDVMPYGIAMHLCRMVGDTNGELVMSDTYADKRKKAPMNSYVIDTLPRGVW